MAIADFRAELVAKINTLDIPTYTYMPSVPDPPCALVDYEIGEAVAFQHGGYDSTWHVALCYPFASPDDAQVWFDTHKDPTNTSGLYRTLTDATWTYCDYVRPTGAGQIQYQQLAGMEVLLVDFTLEVVL